MSKLVTLISIAVCLVTACERERHAATQARDDLELPQLQSGAEPMTASAIVVEASRDSISVAGSSISPMSDPVIVAAMNKEAQLDVVVRALSKQPPGSDVMVAVDRRTPYTLLLSLLWSAKRAGFERTSLVVRYRETKAVVPVLLPSRVGTAQRGALPVRPIINMSATVIRVASFSGLAGTLDAPMLVTTTDANGYSKLRTALEQLVRDHYRGIAPAQQDPLTISPATNVTAQVLVEILETVRTDNAGNRLFGDIHLAGILAF